MESDEIVRAKDNSIIGAKCKLYIKSTEQTIEEVGDVDMNALNRNITESELLKLAVSDGIKRCCMRLGIGLELWTGDTTEEERRKAIKAIQSPGSKIRFLVGTTQTGGYGITLTGASTMIYYSNGYDLEKRQQSEARIDRIGQKHPMTYIDLIAEDTIDEKIVKALRKKVNIANEIMGEELKQWI